MAKYSNQIKSKVDELVSFDADVNQSSEKQSTVRFDLTFLVGCHIVGLYPQLDQVGYQLEQKDKSAVNAECFSALKEAGKTIPASKDSIKKMGQGIFNPDFLKICFSVDGDVAKAKAKAKKDLTVKVDGKVKVDAGTFKGLVKALPKQDQGKASQTDKVDQAMRENSVDGSYDLIKKIYLAVIQLDLGNLKKVFSFITNLENTSEAMISNQDDQDIIAEKLPATFSHFSKILQDSSLNQSVE